MVAYHLNLVCIHIYGDSQLIIDGISGKCRMHGQYLSGWTERVMYILTKFQSYTMQHIFRENNTRADYLSKKGLEAPYGTILISHFRDSNQVASYHFPLP